ncbi:hypothetical protein R1flu_015833 [Riccia fluitans]|uniref:Uncharacterized protein n=1 Tax=Riccia fluitans TaxID=41844 RepID=A0ABD1YNZ4_9MARC
MEHCELSSRWTAINAIEASHPQAEGSLTKVVLCSGLAAFSAAAHGVKADRAYRGASVKNCRWVVSQVREDSRSLVAFATLHVVAFHGR